MPVDAVDYIVYKHVHLERFFPGYLKLRSLSSGPGRAIQPEK
jgi:hypothetical protein